MIIVFFLTFCRIVIGSVFAVSFFGKMTNIAAFQATIINFGLLPKQLTKVVAILFILAEFIVTAGMVAGGNLLRLGFLLSAFLLILFSIALITVLVRKIQTSCNCFGPSTNVISYYDVVRNSGFTVFAISGWVVLSMPNTISTTLTLPEVGLVSFVAIAFVMIWTHLAEIVELFRLA